MSASALFVLVVCTILMCSQAAKLESRPANYRYSASNTKYGILVLCENKGYGPVAKFLTSSQKLIARGDTYYNDCKLTRVHGDSINYPYSKQNKNNHKYLWPVKRQGGGQEEFSELKAAFEYQLSCISGQVEVINTVTKAIVYKCDASFDAHVFEYALSG